MPKEPTQRTTPYGTNDDGSPAQPIDIPVPKRADVLRVFDKAAQPIDKPKKSRRRKRGAGK